jgi:hypothetical protein
MKKQQKSEKQYKVKETTTSSKKEKDNDYRLWLKVNNPWFYKMKYGGE